MLLIAALQVGSLARDPVMLHPEKASRAIEYPVAAAIKKVAGVVSLQLEISAQGQVVRCRVTESIRFKPLDDAACLSIVKRWKFEPALSENGTPIAAVKRSAISWDFVGRARDVIGISLPVATLPAGYARPAGLGVEFDATGKADVCRVATSSGSAAADKVACRQVLAEMTIAPPMSGSDLPARADRTVNVSFVATGSPQP